ncbi:GtrA family protein [Labedella endophytica]|uniref:GtrA family protein n=1 Tax=Labedella endophytica TaxID=1523160 RepID=UPI002441D751|nr:GtrA family protein [Labedella endophytica]
MNDASHGRSLGDGERAGEGWRRCPPTACPSRRDARVPLSCSDDVFATSERRTAHEGSVISRIQRSASYLWERVLRYAVKFGVVGGVGFVIDVGLFNLLRVGVFGDDHFFQGAIGAKLVSTSVAIVFNWIGNRYWTFREHRRSDVLREFAEYVAVAIGGLLIGLLCLWVSHHVLGFTSLLADNISANVVGLVLGTAFRFLLYRFWVWGHHRTTRRELEETDVEVRVIAATLAAAPLEDVTEEIDKEEAGQ